MPSTKLLSTSQKLDPAATADLLIALAERIRSGQVHLADGNADVTLELPGRMEVDVDVTREQKRSGATKLELEVEISWYEGQAAAGGGALSFPDTGTQG